VSSGQLVRRFLGHKGPVYAVTFTRNPRYALSGGADNTLCLWDLGDNQNVDNRRRPETDGWPPEAVPNENLARRFQGHTAAVYGVACSADGRTALSAGRDATLRLFVLIDF